MCVLAVRLLTIQFRGRSGDGGGGRGRGTVGRYDAARLESVRQLDDSLGEMTGGGEVRIHVISSILPEKATQTTPLNRSVGQTHSGRQLEQWEPSVYGKPLVKRC